jgi:uncharacterized membrane protein YgdD (TMEM256/DUF423 family)
MRLWIMGLGAIAGLFGAAGVALAAAGAHLAGGAVVTTAADFLLFHAGALVALSLAAGLLPRSGLLCVAASAIALGTTLFSGDLAIRGLAGATPVRLAAPTGGMLLIAGWLVATAAIPLALRNARPFSPTGYPRN